MRLKGVAPSNTVFYNTTNHTHNDIYYSLTIYLLHCVAIPLHNSFCVRQNGTIFGMGISGYPL